MGGYADEFPLLSALGLYAANILGDGNCLFNALSDQLYGHQNEHHSIRARVIHYMKEHADYYKQFLDVYPGGGIRRNPKRKSTGAYSSPASLQPPSQEDIDRVFQQHLQIMARGGTWGDNMEVQAFSSAFDVDVKIYQRDFAYMIQANDTGVSKPVMHIAYHTWEHYSSIRNLDGPHSGQPNVQPRALTVAEEEQQKRILSETAFIKPGMVNAVMNSLPFIVDRQTATRALEDARGSLNDAVSRLMDAEEQTSASSTQENSSIDREEDSDDDYRQGPNKRTDRRMSRHSRHKIGTSYEKSRLAPAIQAKEIDGSQASGESIESDLVSDTDASKQSAQDSPITEPDVIEENVKVESGLPPVTKPPIKIRLKVADAPSNKVSVSAIARHKQRGPLISAREKKSKAKLAQKNARKQRHQAAFRDASMSDPRIQAGITLRSKGMTDTPPIESGFRTLFI